VADAKAAAAPSAPGPSKAPLILALVNTLAVLGAAGTLYYTKMVFKRPAITEDAERKRLEEAHAKKTVAEATAPGTVSFAPITVNIEPFPAQPTPVGDEEAPAAVKGKLHYATVAFSIEIVDGGQKDAVEEVRPVIMDRLLTMMAHKPFHELTTVQGRYVLRTQLMEMVNRLTENLPSHPPLLASEVAKAEKPKGEGEGHGEGGEGHGGEHGGEGQAAKKSPPPGPPIKSLYRDGLVSNVFFTQFIIQ
jgi:flagellar basal body-associated protein FliL